MPASIVRASALMHIEGMCGPNPSSRVVLMKTLRTAALMLPAEP